MNGSRRSTGWARAAVVVALALALLGPGLGGSPTPGGDEGSRSTSSPPSLLLVDLNETSCIAVAPDGKVFTGSDGAGLAEWTADGALSSVHTSVNGLPSNHITDMAVADGSTYAITTSPDPRLLMTGAAGSGWGPTGQVAGAKGPLVHLRGGDQLLVLDARGTVFVSNDAPGWERPDLPGGIPSDGWVLADLDSDVLALSNGTDTVLVDMLTGDWTSLSTPSINDLDLDGGSLAVASDDHPDVYHLTSQSWLDASVTAALSQMGSEWTSVHVQDGSFRAATIEGVVIEASVTVSDPGDLELEGSLNGTADQQVADMDVLADGTVLLATNYGTWALEAGTARPFTSDLLDMPPSNDIMSVAFAGDIMFAMSSMQLFGLTFDSTGNPNGWLEPHGYTTQGEAGPLDAAYLGAVVYLAGFGGGISTYDTFQSSKPTRWGGPYHTVKPLTPWNNVTDVEVVEGSLFLAGPYGLDMLVPESDPPEFEYVDGAPQGILCLSHHGDRLLVGTEEGVWSYWPSSGKWDEPSTNSWAPQGPISSMTSSGDYLYATSGDTIYWELDPGEGSEVLAVGEDIGSIAVHDILVGPVWAVVNGRLLAIIPFVDQVVHEPCSEGLGDALVRDVEVGPDGVGYVATDSGIHRIGQYHSVWTSWTTSNGLSANDIRDLALQPGTDDIWIGAYGGVDVMDTTTSVTTRIGTEDGLPSNLVYDILFEGDAVWVGTDVGGAARRILPSGDWIAYNDSTGLVASDVQALARLDDLMLFGTDEGVTVLDFSSSSYETFTVSSTGGGLPDNWVWCVLADVERFYVGTGQGLGMYDATSSSWTSVDVEGVTGLGVRSLARTDDGNLWIGTDDGLVILSGTHQVIANVGLDDGLPGEQILSLMVGSDGWMWLGNSGGVALVDMDGDVHATFTTDDGLVHARAEALIEHPYGTIWVGTAGGLSKLEKARWDLLEQTVSPREDLPDVYVADIIMDPDMPSAGDDVVFNVRIFNPTSLRAIAVVELALDENGSPGETVSQAIAYTEPGGSYSIELNWTATGGGHTLWFIVDPENRVPETDEGNNVVALNLQVNHPPELIDVVLSPTTGSGRFWNQSAYVDVLFTYRDLDGEHPDYLTGTVEGTDVVEDLITGGSYPATGLDGGHSFVVPMGNSTILIETSDGRTAVNITIDVNINLEITVNGLEGGRDDEGFLRFEIETLEPWEGTSIDQVYVLLVEPGSDPMDQDVWSTTSSISTRLEGTE
ncbi:MAG: hypothetical protein GQ558_06305 [Thermoplasmata archaeon]|nr:hypothetical protein [Thermoplasmata archaeon]